MLPLGIAVKQSVQYFGDYFYFYFFFSMPHTFLPGLTYVAEGASLAGTLDLAPRLVSGQKNICFMVSVGLVNVC